MDLNEKSSIPAFFAGRSIFITGATGFMGKVLIEKLLRSCPDVQEVFLLMRPKKDATIDDRLRKMLGMPLFDKLREENPSAFKKLIPVTGDVADEGLGLPPIERRVLIERVSVIIHGAANVRFDDSLRSAILLNIRGTREMCILAAQMKKLVALLHVSTMYGNVDRPSIDEQLYPPHADWKATIKIAEKFDEQTLNVFAAKYLGPLPNTYVFTKQIAEHVIKEYEGILPSVIFRPSVVIATLEDPFVGWIDNFNGPTGLLIGGGKGVLRTVYADPKVKTNYIPVDTAIKGILISVWQRGIKTITREPNIEIYNCSTYGKTVALEEMITLALKINEEVPLDDAIWWPDVTIHSVKIIYYISVLLFHILPSLIIDGMLMVSGGKPRLLKIHRKIFTAMFALEYFMTREWEFKNKKFGNLKNFLSATDIDAFDNTLEKSDIRVYFRDCVIASKKYLLNEDLAKIPKNKVHNERMWWLDRFVKTWLVCFLIWYLVSSSFFTYLVDYFSNTFAVVAEV